MQRKFLVLLLILYFTKYSNAQDSNEVLQCPIIGASFGYVFPKGDMGDMFSPFLSIGVNGMYKTKKNWIFELNGNFLFGNDNLKETKRKTILKDLHSQGDRILGTDNKYPREFSDAALITSNRGFSAGGKVGKLFPLSKKNPNSGIIIMGGGGIIQNQITFQSGLGNVYQLLGDYAKGYDRKVRGFQLSETIGYWFMSNSSRYLNFYVGFECAQSWSKSVRKYQFDLRGKDTKTYFDQTYTLKVGWMFPLGSRKAVDFYYN